MKVVFMGTPDFAVESLKAILASSHEVVGVVTVPDKKSGRGQKVNASAVKKHAESEGLKVLQPEDLKEQGFLTALKALQADIFVVVAFRMLPPEVFTMPEKGTFNLHGSLLPQYRGAAPINWAVINGEHKTGVTTFFIDEKMDTGEVLLQDECPIEENSTAGEIHDKLMVIGANLVVQTLDALKKNAIQPYAQEVKGELKKAPKIFRTTCMINWNDNIQAIHNHIRGLSPYPGAWTEIMLNEKRLSLKVFQGKILDRESKDLGIEITDGTIKVNTASGTYELIAIQLEGKKRMSSKELINGLTQEQSESIHIVG